MITTLLNITLLWFTPISLLLMGLLVYLNNPKSLTNRLFLVMAITLAGATPGAYAFNITSDLDLKFFWVQFTMGWASFVTPAVLCFVYTYPGDHIKLPQRLIVAEAAAACALLLTVVYHSMFSGVVLSGGNVDVLPGPALPFFAAFFLCNIIAIIYRVVTQIRHSRGLEKVQWQYLAFGVVSMLVIILLFNVILATLLKNNWLVAVGASSFLLLEGSIFYAITRHRLLDVRLVVARAVAYTILLTVLFAGYAATAFVLSALFFHNHFDSNQVLIYSIVAIFVGATFQPFKTWLEQQTDKIFYRNQYSTSSLMATLSKILSSTLDPEKLAQKVLDTVSQTMHIQKSAIFLYQQGEYNLLAQSNYPSAQSCDRQLLQTGEREMILAQGEEAVDRHTRSAMRESGLVLTFPFKRGEDIRGLLLLGEKQSGDLYTNQDIQLLEILGPELAVAIENARSFQQIRDFNQTLQIKVERATEELRSVNEQLERKNRQLEQLDRLKDEFISVTSHELRTPLTAIRGYLWMVMNNRKEDAKKDYLNRAYVSTERLIDLVNDTLDISRMESGRVQLNPQPTKLPDIAKLVVQELASKAEERHQKLTVKHVSNIPTVFCDPDKIHQVFTNLIGNALKFTPEKGSISVHFYTEKNHVVTAISDTGPGISPEDQKRLFQKFMRLEPTANQPGTGLGLYLCHRVITLSKGKIWVDSQIGQGSTFFFSLPISKDQASILPIERKLFAKS